MMMMNQLTVRGAYPSGVGATLLDQQASRLPYPGPVAGQAVLARARRGDRSRGMEQQVSASE